MEESLDSYLAGEQELKIVGKTKQILISAANWSIFISIAFLLLASLMLIAAIILASFSEIWESSRPFPSSYMILFYLLSAIFLAIPFIFLLRFALDLKKALNQGNQALINQSLNFLKRYFQFFGILIIVTLAIYIIGIVTVLAFAGTF